MSEHLDTDALADALAGDREHREHLAGCAQCQAALARLEAALPHVTAALAQLPLPAQPADLEDRLARSLRPAPVSGDVIPDIADARARRWAKPLTAVAGVAAAAALVVGGLSVVGGSSSSEDGQPGSTAAARDASTITNSTGSAYRKDGKLLAQELPTLLGAVTADVTAPEAAPQSLSTKAGGGVRAAQDEPLARLRTTTGLAECITALTSAGEVTLPLALDYATFEGQPALVVVLPSRKADKVDVFVVGPTCAPADAAVLYFARLPKPTGSPAASPQP